MNFCAIVSIEFLAPFLVAQQSLASSHAEPCVVDVLCMDAWTVRALERLDLPGVRLTPVEELERADLALAGVKAGRLAKEYCWTAKSSFALHLFEQHPEIDVLTYVDSDLEFHGDLGRALAREDEAAVYLYPQRTTPDWKSRDRHLGDFNGGTITFRRSSDGLAALRWWREQCLEWCYSRVGRLDQWADQKYLDAMPLLFPATVVGHPGVALAPWNARQRRLELRPDGLVVDGEPLVFYHFASLHLYDGVTIARRMGLLRTRFRYTGGAHPLVWRAWEKKGLTDAELELLWEPYLRRLGAAMRLVRRIEPMAIIGMRDGRRVVVREWAGGAAARARGRRSKALARAA